MARGTLAAPAAWLRNEGANGAGDALLLARFAHAGDEAAFAEIVRRHGPRVLGVCRRVTGHEQDAEEALQATFLVLARKAASLADGAALAAWLHGVAYRKALKARASAARRRARERQVERMPHPTVEAELYHDLPSALDRELAALPEGMRAAVILCELEGRPRREAAGLLGIPEGTLSSRLAAARRRLADGLRRRGEAPAALAAAWASGPTPLPAGLAARVAAGALPAGVGHVVPLAGVLVLAAVAGARGQALWEMGQAQRAADRAGAVKALAEAAGELAGEEKEGWWSPMFRQVMHDLAEAGGHKEAVALIDRSKSPRVRALGLVGVIEGMAAARRAGPPR